MLTLRTTDFLLIGTLLVTVTGGTGEFFLLSRRLFLTGMLALTGLTMVPTSGLGQATASPPTNASAATGSFQVHTPDGLTLAAYAQGDPASPEILLIHGLGQCYLSWERQLRDPALAGFRIVSFDLRGHGDSGKPDSAAAYADGEKWGDDVAAVIAAAGLRRPVLVGWSLGGAVMLSYLKKHGTKDVAGINFVDAVTGYGPDLMRPASKDFAARLGSKDLNVRSDAISSVLRACFATPPPQDELDRMIAYNGMVPRVLHQALKISDEGFDQVVQNFDGPILVTFGAKDLVLFPKMAERVRELNPRAKISTYPEAGHTPFYEDAPRFNRELAALVRSADDTKR